MSKLEAVVPDSLVTVVNVQWFGFAALELTYKLPGGMAAPKMSIYS